MKHYDKTTLNLIKIISLFMAVAAILLVVTISTAAGGGGDTPSTAVTLDNEVNRGHLEPLEQHWFKFVPDTDRRAIDVEKSLTLIFTPKETYTQDYVHFYVYEDGQAQFYLDGDVNNMSALGGGTMVERDDNPVTGELVWTGWVFGPKTYYIGVFNNSDFPIDYHLFNADVKSAPLGEPEPPPEAETTTAPPEEVEGHPDVSDTDPVNTASLDSSGLTKGKLQPNSTGWYEFTKLPNPSERSEVVEAGFTLFATPLDGNSSHNVQVELFTYDQTDRWLRGTPEDMANFGAGAWVERDGDNLTGERVWKGSVIGGDTYLVAIRNSNNFDVDFWLFEGDIIRPELGPKTVSPTRVFAAGEAPSTAVTLKVGENTGRLSPGQQAWHQFLIADFDDEAFEEVALTMVFTPDDGGNRVHYVNMDVFEASGAQYWSPTDLDNRQIKNMGAGSIVFRDNNPWTGERVWQGWVVDNNVYLVQVRNGSDVDIDYHVFTGDVYQPPLGTLQPVAEIAGVEPGTAPGAALDLGLGVNKGSLAVGETVWYNFGRADVPAGGGETVFTLVFTPNEGDRVNKINIEVFDANQLTNWAPELVINGFGESTTLDRDKNPQTGEIHWRGIIYPNAPYYVRLGNNSDAPVDYWLFPEDVIDVNLQ